MMLSNETLDRCSTMARELSLPENFSQIIETIYAPLLTVILEKYQGHPLLLSINGAQGTGKSTMKSAGRRIKSTNPCGRI